MAKINVLFLLSLLLVELAVVQPSTGLSMKDWDRWTIKAKFTFQKVVEAAGNAVDKVKDVTLGERCNKRWIIANVTGLRKTLQTSLCGQHIAAQRIISSFQSFERDFKNGRSKQPLGFLFYGGHGNGKTYAAQILIEHLYRKGERSRFVHVFSPVKDFPDRTMDFIYANRLRQKLLHYVSICPHQLFIFDDFHQMANLMDLAIKPLLSTTRLVSSHDFSRSIFVFIGTSGHTDVLSTLVAKYKSGVARTELTAYDFPASPDSTMTCDSDQVCDQQLTLASLVLNVPFLPLEREHVECCIQTAARRQGCVVSQRDELLTQMVEFTDHERWQFAAAGCKKLAAQLGELCP